MIDLHKSGSSLGAISKRLKVPRSSVQTIVRKYKHHGTTQPSYRWGRRCILPPRDERALVRKVQINPRTAKDFVKMLEETGTKVSISIIKRVLYWHNLKFRSARKKPQLQNHNKKARLRFATAHGDKDRTFWRNVLRSDETKIELFGHNNCLAIMFGGKRGRLASQRTPSELWNTEWQHHVVGVLCCWRDWCTSQNRWHHEVGKLWIYWSKIPRHQSGS